MKILPSLLLLTVAFLFTLKLYAQGEETPDFVANRLDDYVEEALEKWNIPGVAVAVVKDGEIVVARGYGLRHYQSEAAVDEHTLFMIASNTKAFVGTAIALLANDGSLSQDDKVTQFVPQFRMYHADITNKVTIRDLLTHRLGLQTFQGDFLYFYSNLQKEDVYQKFPLIEPAHEFRDRYGYCNAGYFWAGEVIESVTGEDWEKFIDDRIITPLKMNRTLMLSEGLEQHDNLAAAHTLQNGILTSFPHTNIDVIGAAASMSSSVADLSHWLIAQLDSGRYEGREVIPFEVIKQTRQPLMLQGKAGHLFNQSNYSLYSMGWSLRDYEGLEVVSHSGGILGFVTGVTLVPDLNLGVVVLTNSDENWFYEALKWEIIDAYLQLPYRNYSNRYHELYSRRQQTKNNEIAAYRDTIGMAIAPSLPLKAYTGTYSNPVYGEITIVLDDNLLQLHFENHPDLSAQLEHINGNRFLCSYYPSRMGTEVFPFTIEGKRVRGFSLKVADRLEYTRYFFGKTLK